MSYIPSVSQVEFSRHAKAPQPTCRALLRQRTTSAVRDKHIQAGSNWGLLDRIQWKQRPSWRARDQNWFQLSNWGLLGRPIWRGVRAKREDWQVPFASKSQSMWSSPSETHSLGLTITYIMRAGDVRLESSNSSALWQVCRINGYHLKLESMRRQSVVAGGQV
jgi:hypothetical protein